MAAKINVPVGSQSYELTFLEELPDYKCKCLCSCGKEVLIAKFNFTSGHTKSCGHLILTTKSRLTHGRTANGVWDRTYRSYVKMLERVRYPHLYPTYAGTTVCARWDNRAGGSFENFLADMGERPEEMSIDRIDPAGNYEPGNCRWATPLEQSQNRRAWKHTPEGLARITLNLPRT